MNLHRHSIMSETTSSTTESAAHLEAPVSASSVAFCLALAFQSCVEYQP